MTTLTRPKPHARPDGIHYGVFYHAFCACGWKPNNNSVSVVQEEAFINHIISLLNQREGEAEEAGTGKPA